MARLRFERDNSPGPDEVDGLEEVAGAVTILRAWE